MGGKVEINGIDITYKEAGSGSDIIMIHGIFASKEIMNPLFDYCKNDYHVISYDLRGHGESGKTENFTKEQQVLDMDVWRALTELDAQTADAEEIKRQTQSLK